MEQYTPVALSLLTILASGLTSAIVTFRLNRAKEHEFFMRKKAEELYLALERYDKILSSNLFSYFPLFDGRLDYNQFLDIHNANLDPKEAHHHDHLVMITRIYFPKLEKHLLAYERARAQANKLTIEHKTAYKAGEASAYDWNTPFAKFVSELGEEAKLFKSAIVTEGRYYSESASFTARFIKRSPRRNAA